MADRKQFEAMLDALINEDHETAQTLFHNIVVSKSREIYEELLAEDFSDDQGNPYSDEDEGETEGFESDDDKSDEGDDEGDDEDETDIDISGSSGSDDDGEIEDRVMDLEDALEDLKAEFEQLLAGEQSEEERDPDIHNHELDSLFNKEDDKDDNDIEDDHAAMMEYTIKVPVTHGDNGVQNKSPVADKNDMGGTTANIARGGSGGKGGTQGGLLNPSTREMNAGNVNVPGAKNATKLSPVSKGHGAERKGTSDSPGNSKGPISGRVR